MTIRVGCIVEGYGEVEAVPLLLRRIASEVAPGLTVEIPQPVRTQRTAMKKPGELERAVALIAAKLGGRGGVLLLLDADDDCPAELGPILQRRLVSSRSDMPSCVVLAKREYEAWFITAAESLRGKRGFPVTLRRPDGDPERIRGAKEWLSTQLGAGRRYVETLDQPALTAAFDLAAARSSPSFDRCYRKIQSLLIQLQTASGPA